MTDAEHLAATMTACAIQLAALVGLPDETPADRILDADQVPCAVWNAATTALEVLLLGMEILDSCKDAQPMIHGKLDAELAALLGRRES